MKRMFKPFHLAGVLFVGILVPSILMIATEPVPADAQVACTADAKLCPDGSYVGRDPSNNCAWYRCPASTAKLCKPYQCGDGTQMPRCTEDGQVISYFADPCFGHGGTRDAFEQVRICTDEEVLQNATNCAPPYVLQQEHDGGSTAFADVTSDHPNADAIFYVKSEGIVEGYSDGTYKPDATINRAEFVKILMETFEDDGRTCKIAPFSDVDQSAWYATFAHEARCHGIVEGYSDGTFKPANGINFVEAAKILAKTFGLEASTTIPACDGDCPWYRPYVLMLEMRGAIPTSVTRFDQNITRGEMAEMIYRLKTGNNDRESRTHAELQAQADCDARVAAGHPCE